METLEAEADVLRALAHPVRLHILEILAQGAACVCHLMAVTGRRQANVSQHLAVLRKVGLVRDYKDGVLVYYGLNDQRLPEVITRLREVAHIDERGGSPFIPTHAIPGCPCPKCSGRLEFTA